MPIVNNKLQKNVEIANLAEKHLIRSDVELTTRKHIDQELMLVFWCLYVL